ncbi:MAG: MerR family DNA-binding transcriptional regulator [Pseudomonadota bacterium]
MRDTEQPSDGASHDDRDAPLRNFTITELADEFGVTPRAIRFYEAKGLLAPTRVNGARVYSRRERGRLSLILRGKRVGYSLDDIRQFLDLYDADRTGRTQLAYLESRLVASIDALEAKRRDIEMTLSELRQMKSEVDARLATED